MKQMVDWLNKLAEAACVLSDEWLQASRAAKDRLVASSKGLSNVVTQLQCSLACKL